MEPRTLQYMIDACQGQQLRGTSEQWVSCVSTDSRRVQAGDLFVALQGERFDGHLFVGEVAHKGAVGVVLETAKLPEQPPDCAIIGVENTRLAFGRMAARYRRDFSLPLVAVAGSNGKTTTKEILATVLRQKFETLSSKGSFNNDIGVPATLLELTAAQQVAVLEFGTNHPGELAPLLHLAQPRLGVLTSIGREHLEFFGGLEGVIQEEGALAEQLPPEGTLFLNGDTPGAAEIAARSPARVVRVGLNAGNDWRAVRVRMSSSGVSFHVRSGRAEFGREFRLPLLGRHQAVNALLAVAVAAELGLTPEEVQAGLNLCLPAKMRLQLWELNGVQILDDSYNANADSMRAALETIRDLPCRGRRMAVLADMAELGDHAPAAHAEIGRQAAEVGLDRLFTLGTMGSILAQAARDFGLGAVQECGSIERAAQTLKEQVRAGDLVLLKGSRSMGLERIGALLRAEVETVRRTDADQWPNSLGNG